MAEKTWFFFLSLIRALKQVVFLYEVVGFLKTVLHWTRMAEGKAATTISIHMNFKS